MRQGSNPRRSRGRGPRKPHNPSRPQSFDNSGSEMRIRGNAYQVMEKYLAMARDASAAGDRIAMENYLQHAEHYYRMLNANGDANRQRPPMRNDGQGPGGYGQESAGPASHGSGANSPAGNGFDGRGDDPAQQGGGEPQTQSPVKATVIPEPTDESES